MSSIEDKHLEHIAAMHAVSDYSWHSWNSPIGLIIFLNGLVVAGILVKYLIIMK